ncbi:MAG TPA: glycerophosphodiester phosphodiesterase [Bacillales bacterium]|nr:glycerophosphodiester phosphodiesterase [Bacillales bacterium]
MTQIFAHRGSSGTHPENTMAAFIEAERVKADGIEFDVQMTKDKEVVVIHDERVDRTTNGRGWVKDFTLKELKKLNTGSTKIRSEKIPTLKEVLGWAKGNPLLINIELKTGLIQYPNLEERVVEMVNHYGLKDKVILSSFNHYSVERVHKLDPGLETAILFMEGLFEPWKYAKSIGASGLHCHWRTVTEEFVDGAKKANMALRPFTINRRSHIRKFLESGCSGIFTDYPERAIQIRDKGGIKH